MKSLRPDVSGLSEIAIILLAIVVIIALVVLVTGGLTLVFAIFFGGLLGLGFGLLVFGFIALFVSFFIRAFAKLGLLLGLGLIVIGVVLMGLGALGL